MGRRYSTELAQLQETYSWALETPIEPVVAAISASAHLPLVAVGSGGSFSAAHLACWLHQRHSGMTSRPLTPLELLSSALRMRSLSTMIISAGGSNPDILAAVENAITREPRRCVVLCLRKRSKLSRMSQMYRFVDRLELTPPCLRDGFLATNSLLAFAVLLVRAYDQAFSGTISLPRDLAGFLPDELSVDAYADALRPRCQPLWKRETLVVLYGPSASTAALDLESKFAEAALGNIQLADFRNFAHGRHHWLAKRQSRTGVLAMFAGDERDLAEKTLRLIPAPVPVVSIALPSVGPTASLGALLAVLQIVGLAGERHKIDPGRPGVPPFGRRIYALRALRGQNGVVSNGEAAVARKLGCDVSQLRERGDLSFWQSAYERFVGRLSSSTFGAILLDYDGTLCDARDRLSGPRDDVAFELTRLLKGGMLLGIATGRGDSVRRDLRKVLPDEFWGSVHIAYHNGSELGRLSDEAGPNAATLADSLRPVAESLVRHPLISRLGEIRPGGRQISVRLLPSPDAELVWRLIQPLAQMHGDVALRSGHSIDVVLPGVSKSLLLEHIRGLLPPGHFVLAVGDKGQWPGNDHDLLSTPHALSVDEVSADPETCWNIAPPGHRGTQAVLDYLGWLKPQGAGFRVAFPRPAGRLL